MARTRAPSCQRETNERCRVVGRSWQQGKTLSWASNDEMQENRKRPLGQRQAAGGDRTGRSWGNLVWGQQGPWKVRVCGLGGSLRRPAREDEPAQGRRVKSREALGAQMVTHRGPGSRVWFGGGGSARGAPSVALNLPQAGAGGAGSQESFRLRTRNPLRQTAGLCAAGDRLVCAGGGPAGVSARGPLASASAPPASCYQQL